MFTATMVINASNHAKIEKHDPVPVNVELVKVNQVTEFTAYENCSVKPDYIVIVTPANYVMNDVIEISAAHVFKAYEPFNCDMEARPPLTIEIFRKGSYADWKPFGKIKTKYHSAWLFEPIKLC